MQLTSPQFTKGKNRMDVYRQYDFRSIPCSLLGMPLRLVYTSRVHEMLLLAHTSVLDE